MTPTRATPRRGATALARVLVVLALLTGLSLAAAPAASAHPLGNATVNHYDGLSLFPDHITVRAIEDTAEIPTLQRGPDIDSNSDGALSVAERAGYAARQCRSLAAAERLSTGGHRLALSVLASDYTQRPGAIQLSIGRLVCQLQATADLSRDATVTIDDQWDSEGIGWHEITAVSDGVSLQNSPFPASSISDELLRYPNNLLSSPLDVHSGSITVHPGDGAASTYRAVRALPGAALPVRALNALANRFNALVGAKHLTVGVGLLAVLLSMLLGAGHAFLPGHGKTIMAAYLVGRRGRLRDVVTVGATVTLTHTAGVLVLGALISLTAAFAPTAAEQDLAVVSGLLVAGVGVGLLVGALRRRSSSSQLASEVEDSLVALDVRERVLVGADGPATQPSPDASTHSHDHAHGHGHPHPHRHGHGPGHGEPQRFGRSGLIGLGVAGGLVPSPSALLVLLAAIALGRTAFGVILVLGYGLGMAGALTAAGLILVRLRGRLSRVFDGRSAATARLVNALPVLTACLVLVVGVGLTLRAIGGAI